MQIAIEGREAAEAWKKRAEILNEKTEKILKEVGADLKSIEDFADGSLIDEIVNFGDGVITATTSLMSGMNKIYDVVNNLLSNLASFLGDAMGIVSGLKNITG